MYIDVEGTLRFKTKVRWCLDITIRSGQVRSGQVRSGQVRSGLIGYALTGILDKELYCFPRSYPVAILGSIFRIMLPLTVDYTFYALASCSFHTIFSAGFIASHFTRVIRTVETDFHLAELHRQALHWQLIIPRFSSLVGFRSRYRSLQEHHQCSKRCRHHSPAFFVDPAIIGCAYRGCVRRL